MNKYYGFYIENNHNGKINDFIELIYLHVKNDTYIYEFDKYIYIEVGEFEEFEELNNLKVNFDVDFDIYKQELINFYHIKNNIVNVINCEELDYDEIRRIKDDCYKVSILKNDVHNIGNLEIYENEINSIKLKKNNKQKNIYDDVIMLLTIMFLVWIINKIYHIF